MVWLFLAWLSCPFIGRWFYPQDLARGLLAFSWITALAAAGILFRIEKDSASETRYRLPSSAGPHGIQISVPSQRTMAVIVCGTAEGTPDPTRLKVLEWSLDAAVPVRWFGSGSDMDLRPFEVPLVLVDTPIEENVVLHCRIPKGREDVLSGCMLVVRHDRGGLEMLNKSRFICRLLGILFLMWGLGCLLVQIGAETSLKKARRLGGMPPA